jgi:predicted amidohydrolase
MRIACFQGPEAADTPAGNLARLGRTAAEAKAGGAELLVCPEMFLTGYALGRAQVARLAEPLDGASVGSASRIAAETGLALVFGLPERHSGKVFNAVVAIGANGKLLASYRKTHLFGEVDREQFSAGDAQPEIFEVGGLKASLLICYDVEFPESVRALALAGAELVIVPTALMMPFDVVAKTIVPARAYENQLFVAYANRCGREAAFDYCGSSCVVGPDGVDLARAGRGEELIFAEIDPAALERSRQLNPYLRDRRPELYGRLATSTESPT